VAVHSKDGRWCGAILAPSSDPGPGSKRASSRGIAWHCMAAARFPRGDQRRRGEPCESAGPRCRRRTPRSAGAPPALGVAPAEAAERELALAVEQRDALNRSARRRTAAAGGRSEPPLRRGPGPARPRTRLTRPRARGRAFERAARMPQPERGGRQLPPSESSPARRIAHEEELLRAGTIEGSTGLQPPVDIAAEEGLAGVNEEESRRRVGNRARVGDPRGEVGERPFLTIESYRSLGMRPCETSQSTIKETGTSSSFI
jgi:hypothetical protein